MAIEKTVETKLWESKGRQAVCVEIFVMTTVCSEPHCQSMAQKGWLGGLNPVYVPPHLAHVHPPVRTACHRCGYACGLVRLFDDFLCVCFGCCCS